MVEILLSINNNNINNMLPFCWTRNVRTDSMVFLSFCIGDFFLEYFFYAFLYNCFRLTHAIVNIGITEYYLL